MAPWRDAGQNALKQMMQMLTPGADNSAMMQLDPGYQFRVQEGLNALKSAGLASGNYGSGNMGIALQNYGQQQGMEEFNSLYNRLFGVSAQGMGQGQAIANLGTQNAQYMGGNALQGAQAQGQGYLGQAGAWGNALAGASNQAMSGLGTYMNYQNQQNQLALMNKYLGQQGGGGYGGGYGGGGTDWGSMFNDPSASFPSTFQLTPSYP
jgi:hypothetical protein